MSDLRIAKWTRWIDGTIKNNVLTMYLQRDAWLEVSKILQANDQLPESYWWEFMRDTYVVTQAVAVRRQADTHPDAASLGKLLNEVAADSSRLTRDRWLGLWNDPDDPFMRMSAERAWKDQFGGNVGDHLDPEIPEADLAALTAAAGKVRGYVDKHVAHADAAAVSKSVTLTVHEMHEAVDVIGGQFKRYYNLLTASSWASLVPAIQHDWKAIFRQPWMRPRASER